MSAQLSTAARVSSFSNPLTSTYSLVMVTVKVSSPREQENLALQVSSVLSVEAVPPTPAAVSSVGFVGCVFGFLEKCMVYWGGC